MNLLFVTAEYPPERCGGIGVFYQDLARQMAQRGCRVTVAAPSLERCADSSEGLLSVLRWHGSLAASNPGGMLLQRIRFTRFVRAVARELAPDLIETHDWGGPLTAAPGRPFVVRLHGTHSVLRAQIGRRPSATMRVLERRLIRSADAVVAVSSWIGRETAGVFDVPRPVAVIANGVETGTFHWEYRSRKSEELLFVGTVKAEKGVFELFRALPLILGARPQLGVRIVGPYKSDVVRRLLASIPEALAARVLFEGAVARERLPELYAAATVCVLPSLVEAFGLTMAEAMSCGGAVVGSALGAGPDLAEHGREALLVDPRNPHALAESVLECLSDEALRERLARGARQRALRKFSWDVVAEQNLQFYLKAIEGARTWPKSA